MTILRTKAARWSVFFVLRYVWLVRVGTNEDKDENPGNPGTGKPSELPDASLLKHEQFSRCVPEKVFKNIPEHNEFEQNVLVLLPKRNLLL